MHAGLAVGEALKLHAARVVYSGSGEAVPADALAGFVVDDFGFPLDMRAERRLATQRLRLSSRAVTLSRWLMMWGRFFSLRQ